MFGGLAAKMLLKKQLQKDVPQGSAEVHSELIHRASPAAASRDEKSCMSDPPGVSMQSVESKPAPSPPPTQEQQRMARHVPLMAMTEFEMKKEAAAVECASLIEQVTAACPALFKPQLSTTEGAEAEQSSRMNVHEALGCRAVSSFAYTLQGRTAGVFASGLASIANLSPLLVTCDDAAKPSSDNDATILREPLLSGSWAAPTSAERDHTMHAITSLNWKRATIAVWIWRGLLMWRLRIIKGELTYDVHRAEADSLTPEEVRVRGARIASHRQALREYASAHTALCRFLVALLHDCSAVESLNDASSKSAPQKKHRTETSSRETLQSSPLMLPDKMVDGFYSAVMLSSRGNAGGSEQAYYETVIGTEKWRLGLYSAGDMHMRHTLEKTQRDRVVHILNNEQAMASFHAFKKVL